MRAHHSPKIGYLDGYRYQLAILSGCKQIIKPEKELNKLSVGLGLVLLEGIKAIEQKKNAAPPSSIWLREE